MMNVLQAIQRREQALTKIVRGARVMRAMWTEYNALTRIYGMVDPSEGQRQPSAIYADSDRAWRAVCAGLDALDKLNVTEVDYANFTGADAGE